MIDEHPPRVSDGLMTLIFGMIIGIVTGLFYGWIFDQLRAIALWVGS